MENETTTSQTIAPSDNEVREYMELHNADEAGEDNQWTMEDARYHLELDDEWYYKRQSKIISVEDLPF